jgi:CubicO group peptidase (beta-lactamase class C family)
VNAAIDGWVAPGFEPVRDAFAANFDGGTELGAAVAVTYEGEPVVDLWGGIADETTGRPWGVDTLQVLFSGTKALVALCLLMLVDRGQLDLEAPVSRYWPEFGAQGKRHLKVAELVSHRARLPGVRTPLSEDDVTDGERLAALLADQPAEPDPRARTAYHAFTFGWLCGELLRRIDGRTVGRFFADEVAAPLGLEVWIGLPANDKSRVSVIRYGPQWGQRLALDGDAFAADPLLASVWGNPPMFPADHIPWNRSDWHAAEIPGAGGIGTARSVARLFGCLARGGELGGVRLLSDAVLLDGRRERSRRWDELHDGPDTFAAGFQLQTELHPFGPPPDAFGHRGAGGSVHCAWPTQRVGISYAMNQLDDQAQVDPRSARLLEALWEVAG